MFFQKKAITSNATRNTFRLSTQWYKTSCFKPLSIYKKGRIGRTKQGAIVCWTKGAFKYKIYNINLLPILRYNVPTCFLTYYYNQRSHKFFLLSINALGWFYYVPATTMRFLFNYMFVSNNFLLKLYFIQSNVFFLFQINKKHHINYIEDQDTSLVKYIKSNGVAGKILSANFANYSILLQLPSGAKKVFSRYTKASVGTVLLNKKNYINTKSGYWRNLGYNVKVRGVAMNPVDHPHGGRTKSIRYPRTPWGFTTKYK